MTIWKLDDPDVLKKEKLIRDELKKAKENQRNEALLKQRQKEEKAKIHPKDLFITRTDLYSKFDEKGIPVLDVEGKELSKNSLKKILKEYEQQQKMYDEHQSRVIEKL